MTDCLEVMPSSENCIHKYDEKKEGHKQEQVSDVIYYDFEAVLPRVDGQTGVYSTHEACSYVLFAVNKDEPASTVLWYLPVLQDKPIRVTRKCGHSRTPREIGEETVTLF